MAFQMGAFQLAAATGVPVHPIVLTGTRSALRGDQWFPRRARLRVDIGAPLQAAGDDWAAAVDLRDAARDWILRQSGEPDLGQVRASDVLRSLAQD